MSFQRFETIRVLISFMLVASMCTGCGGRHTNIKRTSLGRNTSYVTSRAEHVPMVKDVTKNTRILLITFSDKLIIPECEYDAFREKKVRYSNPDLFEMAVLGSVQLALSPLSAGFVGTEKTVKTLGKTFFGESETLSSSKVKENLKETGQTKTKFVPLVNRTVYVSVNGEMKTSFNTDKHGAISIPIRKMAAQLSVSSATLNVTVETATQDKVLSYQVHYNADEIAQLGLNSIYWCRDYSEKNQSFEVAEGNTLQGFDFVSQLIQQRSEDALAKYRSLPTDLVQLKKKIFQQQPKAPALVKDQFESTILFNQRVSDERVAYRKKVDSYNSQVRDLELSIKQHYATRSNLPENQINQIIETAFFDVFGAPVLQNQRYDADTQTFFVDLISDSPYARNFKKTLVLEDKISNSTARKFYQNVLQAEPEVELSIDRGQMSWKRIKLVFNDRMYIAQLTDVDFTPPNMRGNIAKASLENVDLSDYTMDSSRAANAVQVSLREDPEIARLQREIYEREQDKSRENAKVAELARLRRQLAVYEDEKTLDTKPNDKTRRLLASLPQGRRNKQNTVALIIGNCNYQRYHRDIVDVQFAHNDAEGMKTFVSRTLGVPDRNTYVLHDATQSQLISYFGTAENSHGRLSDLVGPETELFVYYSGHGAPALDTGSGYLLPVDADTKTISLTGYSVDTLCRNLEALNAGKVTLVLDACFSGMSAGGDLVKNASPAGLRIKVLPQRGEKLNVLAAAGSNETASWDQETRLGLFTRHFLEGVSGKADSSRGGNHDGKISIAELERYLQREVSYSARTIYSRDQTPQVYGGKDHILVNM